jgi:hypothetical protein
MPNGKPGDHPYTDIITHGLRVYSARVDDLVREITRLGDERTIRHLADELLAKYNQYSNPDIEALERELTALRDKLKADAAHRGWEID